MVSMMGTKRAMKMLTKSRRRAAPEASAYLKSFVAVSPPRSTWQPSPKATTRDSTMGCSYSIRNSLWKKGSTSSWMPTKKEEKWNPRCWAVGIFLYFFNIFLGINMYYSDAYNLIIWIWMHMRRNWIWLWRFWKYLGEQLSYLSCFEYWSWLQICISDLQTPTSS